MTSDLIKALFITPLTVDLTRETAYVYLRLISINLNVLNFKPLSFMEFKLGISRW